MQHVHIIYDLFLRECSIFHTTFNCRASKTLKCKGKKDSFLIGNIIKSWWWRISADTSQRSVICYRAFCRSTRRADRYAPHNVIGTSQITTIGVGVELGRVVATTISARLRDDGIRPVIYPTHSDPQSRARARATPGAFPSACTLVLLPLLLLSRLSAPAQPWTLLTSHCLPYGIPAEISSRKGLHSVKRSKLQRRNNFKNTNKINSHNKFT